MKWQDLSILLGRSLPIACGLALAGVAAFAIYRQRRHAHAAREALRDAVRNDLAEPLSLHPEIDPALCAGCGACVRVCPEGDILKMIDHKAVLVEATKCVGHGECEAACPFSAIQLVFGTKRRGFELPRVTGNYETNVKGLYIAGELGGMGLIRNAVRQGKLAAEHAIRSIARDAPKANFDLVIVGAGSAGLTAALAAIAARKHYLCVEQNSVGGTIANFPRQKVVMSQPAVLPIVGTMRFSGHRASKEELLAYWKKISRSTGLKVNEGCRFVTLQRRDDGIFQVETTKGPVTARKVILAMGVRGTPRKLGLANEDLPKVTYNLIEPEQYQNKDIAIVGGGNAAAEAVQMLADAKLRNRVTLLVRSPAMNRCNTENQNKVLELAQSGRIKLRFNSEVKEIHKAHLVIDHEGRRGKLPNHYLFIFAGTVIPSGFLQSLGIKIEKKFGQAR